jgi:GNAT superfamily N-acetyltransferase
VTGFRLTVGERNQSLADRLDQEIYDFNVDQTGLADGRLLSVRARAADGSLAGGLSGWTWGGCLYVDLLWVREDQRAHGLGSQILAAAEQESVRRGCVVASLSTHSFQAPGFYLGRGYVEVGRTDGYPVGHSQLHLRKELLEPELTGAPPAAQLSGGPARRPR